MATRMPDDEDDIGQVLDVGFRLLGIVGLALILLALYLVFWPLAG